MEKPIIRTASDLQNIPDYLPSIDPATHPLQSIITGYYLDVEYPCGLKGCHQPHKEGFLVALENGGVSNVGWKCGEHFGEKFAVERTRYAERELRPKAIRIIQETVTKIQGVRQELNQLEAEADRLSQCKQGMRSQLPKLYAELERRAHNGNNRVTEQIERGKKEIDDLHALNPGSSRENFRYKEEFRGVLQGLQILATNIREDVITQFTGKAGALLSITSIGGLGTEKLLEWERWSVHFDEMLAQAKSTIAAGNSFFASDSFRLMAHIATLHTEKAALPKLTAASLLRNSSASSTVTIAAPSIALSKKQRDSQKKLAAILQKNQREI